MRQATRRSIAKWTTEPVVDSCCAVLQQVAITLPHGEAIKCTYYYTRAPIPLSNAARAPVMTPWLYVLVGGMLVMLAWIEMRVRRRG